MRTFSLTLMLMCLISVGPSLGGLSIGGSASAQSPDGPAAQDSDAAAKDPDVADEDFEADVRELVDQLDASQLIKRQGAERELIDKGPGALPFLPTDRSPLSAEARMRLTRVRMALEKEKAKVQTDAIVIRLAGAETLDAALEKVSAASGVEFELSVDGNTPVELGTVGPLSFWQALDTVLDAARLDIDFYGGGDAKLALVPRAEKRPDRIDSGAYAGVYRLEPMTVNARRVLNNPAQSGMNISIQIAWEPRLTPIGLTLPLDQLQAKLDDGAVLTPLSTEGDINVAANAGLSFSEIGLPLQLPDGRPRKIESLSGLVRALIPGPSAAFKFALKDGTAESQNGSVTVKLDAIRANGPLHELRVLMVLEDANRSLESHRQWVFDNPAYVTSADGTRGEHLGYQVYRETANEVGIGYLFDLGENPDAFSFHYETPTGVVPNEVAFVIPDILLP